MQDYLHASHDEVLGAVVRFEKMIGSDKIEYFDVHQVEVIYDYYFEKSELHQAEKILQIGLSQHPTSTSLLLKKAILLAENDSIDEALQILEYIAPIESTNSEVFLTLGWIMLQKQNTKQAIAYYNKAVSISYDDKEDLLLEISYNLNQHELYIESIKFLEQVLFINSNNENALFEYAFSLDKVLEYSKSIEAYKLLLEKNPFSENAWYNIGIIYNKTGNYLEASKAYDFTIAINPNHEEAYFNKGNSLVQSGCFSEALEAYTEHVTKSKDTTLTYQYIADCWEQLNNYDLAIRFYKLTIERAPKQADAWYGLGTALMETGNFNGGIESLDQAISINPLNADYWFAHARGLFELEKVEDAARSLENGLNLDPNELTGWIELLKLKIILMDDFSLTDYISILHNQYPDVAAIHYLSSVIYFHYLKDKSKALSALRNGLIIDTECLKYIEEDYPEYFKDIEISKLIIEHK